MPFDFFKELILENERVQLHLLNALDETFLLLFSLIEPNYGRALCFVLREKKAIKIEYGLLQ